MYNDAHGHQEENRPLKTLYPMIMASDLKARLWKRGVLLLSPETPKDARGGGGSLRFPRGEAAFGAREPQGG